MSNKVVPFHVETNDSVIKVAPKGGAEGTKEGEEEEEKKLSGCARLIAIVSFFSILATVATATTAYFEIRGYTSSFADITNSWLQLPIVDIKFGSCPNDYERIYTSWPGLSDACDCTTPVNGTLGNLAADYNSNEYSACDDTQINKGCVTLQSKVPPVDVDMFKSNAICIKRDGVNSLTRPTWDSSSGCPSGYQVCGSKTKICFPSSSLCPITDIMHSTTRLTLAGTTELSFSMQNTTQYVYVARGITFDDYTISRSSGSFNASGFPLVDVRFVASDVCTLTGCGYSGRGSEFDSASDAYRKQNPKNGYKINSSPCDGGCQAPKGDSISPSGRDIRYFRVATMQERTMFLQYSGIPTSFVTSNTDYVWTFSARPEVSYNPTCSVSRQIIVDQRDKVSLIQLLQQIVWYIAIGAAFFNGIVALTKFCTAKTNKLSELLSKILKVGNLAAVATTIYFCYKMWSAWEDIVHNLACTDVLTGESFFTLNSILNNLSQKNYMTIGLSAASTITEFIANYF